MCEICHAKAKLAAGQEVFHRMRRGVRLSDKLAQLTYTQLKAVDFDHAIAMSKKTAAVFEKAGDLRGAEAAAERTAGLRFVRPWMNSESEFMAKFGGGEEVL